MEKIKKGKISENSNNLIYINNLNESNNLSSNNISRSNKNLKKYKEVFKNNKNQIKKKKINNLNQNKKQNLKKINDKNKERNKLNKIKEYENQIQNKTSNKNNLINGRKHIFLSPLIKTNNNLENNKSSSKRQKKPNDQKNNLNKYKAINSTSNKEIKKIFFKFRENQSKTKIKKVNGFSKENLNYKLSIKKNSVEKTKFKNDYQKIITLKKDKENSSTIKSEDKNTEKDFNLENNKISEKSTTTKSKNFKDYFKMARKVLKNTSHSLVESITNSNNFYEEIDFKNKISEAGQITNRNQNTESDDDSNNYTIKKVPVFSAGKAFKEMVDNVRAGKVDLSSLLRVNIKNTNATNGLVTTMGFGKGASGKCTDGIMNVVTEKFAPTHKKVLAYKDSHSDAAKIIDDYLAGKKKNLPIVTADCPARIKMLDGTSQDIIFNLNGDGKILSITLKDHPVVKEGSETFQALHYLNADSFKKASEERKNWINIVSKIA